MRLALQTAAWLTLGLAAADGLAAEAMFRLLLAGKRIEGTPLAWDTAAVHLLGRDGRLWRFDPSEATEYAKSADRFRALSVSELRSALLRELGGGFEVTGTEHYLVAHARGQRDVWAQRFEDLYRSMVHYFGVRGFSLREPQFPLIGIVCGNRAEFQQYSAGQGLAAPAGVLGYYSLETNRIALYDAAGGSGDPRRWKQNAATVIHEAAHQVAFNTGVHQRLAPPPLWVAEGLAMHFEAAGVHDSRTHTRQADRINRGRHQQFLQLLPHHKPALLADIVAGDGLFRASPAAAYAEAWALTFYLVETQPHKYAQFLAKTAARPALAPYSGAERVRDFQDVFGGDWRMLEAQFIRFVKGLGSSATLVH